MNINAAYPSKFLKAAELDEDVTYTISSVAMENVAGKGQPEEVKPVVYFEETDKGLGLNKTNANTIQSLYGADTDDWTGKPVTLFTTEVDFQGKQTLAIRIRMKKPAPSAATGKAPGGGPAYAATTPAAKAPSASARANAWALFCEYTPNLEQDDRAKAWADALASQYPGKNERTLTPADWKGFTEMIPDYDEATQSFIPV